MLRLFRFVCALALMFSAGSAVLEAQDKSSSGGRSEMILVDKAASFASIILPKDPTMYTKIAATDLAEYIWKVSGVKPEIIEGAPNSLPAHAIWVGFQSKLKEVFPGTDFEFKHPEEILIKCDGRNLAIVGHDVWDPKAMNIKGGTTKEERSSYLAGFQFGDRDVEGYQFEYGTVNAVYSFLQDKLGIRWIWPGNDGEVIPKQERIALKPFEFRYTPKIRMRQSLFAHQAIYKQGGAPGTASGDWVRRQRVQLDSLYVPFGHGFVDWYPRFFKTHPEYFALQPNGTRDDKGDRECDAKLCDSNPAVWDQWLRDVADIIEKNPHRRVFIASFNDGFGRGYCVCEKCRAWDSPEAEHRVIMYDDTKINGYAMSDRQVMLANMLARKLKEKYPDKDYLVQIRASGFCRPAPIKAVPDDNVVIVNCAAFLMDPDAFDTYSPVEAKFIDTFEAWSKKTKNQIWRPGIPDWGRWKTGGPAVIVKAGEVYKRIAAIGVLGISPDVIVCHWATQGPLYYLLTQLTWNPDLKIDEIMDDYYKSGFGPAAEDIKAYWTMLEKNNYEIQTYERQEARQQKGGKSWIESFSPEFFKEAYALLDKAAEKTSKAGKEYSDRVAFVRAGLDYLRLNTENQILANQIITAKNPDPELKEKMRANWNQIEDIVKKHPQALNKKMITNVSNEYMGYIHPDSDHKAILEKRLRQQKSMVKKPMPGQDRESE